MQHPDITYNQNLVTINFPFHSNIYTLNLDTEEVNSYGGKSSFTNNLAKTTNDEISFEHWNKHLLENVHFYEVNYDRFRNCYYRIHVDKVNYNSQESFLEQLENKNLYLTIFDAQFKIMGEFLLAENAHNLIGGWGVVRDGFLLINSNDKNKQINYEQLQYDIISIL